MSVVNFESDYIKKLLIVSFPKSYKMEGVADIILFRSKWLQSLSSWHSPYKALVDCSHLTVGDDPKVIKMLVLMVKTLQGLHLRKVAGYGLKKEQGHSLLPFDVFKTESEAASFIGVRGLKGSKNTKGDGSFRSLIHIDNHFKEGLMELSFSQSAEIKSSKEIVQLKSKIMNNLMLWHDSWVLVIDCSHLRIEVSLFAEFDRLIKFLNGFFLESVVGYMPFSREIGYPFKVFRSRHKALFLVQKNSLMDRAKADCQSRKK